MLMTGCIQQGLRLAAIHGYVDGGAVPESYNSSGLTTRLRVDMGGLSVRRAKARVVSYGDNGKLTLSVHVHDPQLQQQLKAAGWIGTGERWRLPEVNHA